MDTLFYNGYFYSHASGFTRPEALLVRDGLIIGRGELAEVEQLASPDCERIDAGKRFILPGFNDAHIHIWKVGNLQTFLLDVRHAESLDQLGEMLADAASRLNDKTAWLMARGFNEAAWSVPQLPDRFDLDRYVPDNPVHLMRTCAHIVVLNSAAIDHCGFTTSTRVPTGGEIRLGENQQINGIITESALGIIAPFIPPYSEDQYMQMIKAAEETLFSYGITSATDPAVHPRLLSVYQSLNEQGKLRLRVNAIPILLPDGGLEPKDLPDLYVSPHLKVQTAKLFADGGLSSQTAALKRPYLNISGNALNFGILRIPALLLQELVFNAQEQGFTMAIHAIGDLAIDEVLTVYEKAFRQFPGSRPNRIEHLELPHPEDINRIQAIGTMAIMQPIFIHELGLNFRQSLDSSYLNLLLPIKTLIDHKIVTAFSTDAPVVKDLNPFQNIATAIMRQDRAGYLFSPEQGVTLEQAIFAYTVGSATAEYSNVCKGALEVGMYADMAFLDINPLNTAICDLLNIHVTSTYIGGICVYSIGIL